MRFHSFLAALLVNAALSHNGDKQKWNCTTPTVEESEEVQTQIRRFQSKRNSGITCTQCITIETHFVVFQPDSSYVPTNINNVIYTVDEAKALEQFDVLVDRFKDTPFTFNLASVRIITNNQYYALFEGLDEQIGTQYRAAGGWDTLTCYFGAADQG